MKTLWLLLFLPIFPLAAQTAFSWKSDLDLPYTDPNGQRLTGTEVIHLVAHKGKLYAGNSYWAENNAPRQGQVWVKNSAQGPWYRDFEMPRLHSRVPSLYSFVFSTDKNGRPIPPDTILFAGATRDYGQGSGPAVVFMRNDATGTWITHSFPQLASSAIGYTQIRSMGFFRDPITGADLVFAGAAPGPTGVYAGQYNPASPGKIEWDDKPEFTPSGLQRIMGFARCNDTLFMATQREVYRRINGANPRWVQVANLGIPAIISTYGAGLDPFWLSDDDIRAFRSVPNPTGSGEVLLFSALNTLFRLDPRKNFALVAEQDLESLLEEATGHDFHYIQSQLIVDYLRPDTKETVQLIGFEGFYDTTYLARNPQPQISGFNQQGYYFERRQKGAALEFELREIIDYAVRPQPDSLARVRTFVTSPFPQDSGKVIYSGGFAPWFLESAGGVSNTAWIYRGVYQPAGPQGYRLQANIPYTPHPDPVIQRQLSLDVYTPLGGAVRKPVVVYVHGGSWRTGDKANTGTKDELFTSQDYVFVSVNYRLSPNPVNLADPNRVIHPTHAQDVAKALAWVVANIGNYGGDPNRVGLIGHSAGAHLVSLVATDAALLAREGLPLERVKCTCSLDAGAHDINYYLGKYERPGSSQWETYVNAFTSDPQVWAAASPITHLAPNRGIGPFLLVHQGTPQRIDLHQNFGRALVANQIPTTYLNATPLDHNGINSTLGSTLPAAQTYNDSITNFFRACLRSRSTAASRLALPAPVRAYPNPTAGLVTLELPSAWGTTPLQLSLWSAQGQWVGSFTGHGPQLALNLSQQPAGLYWLRWWYEGRTYQLPVVKQ